MNHLESVKVLDDKKSEWTAKAPLGYEAHWGAMITADVKNERIEWRSVENSEIPNSGKVEFLPTTDRGTVVKVTVRYEPPAGKIGALAAYFLTEEPRHADRRRFASFQKFDGNRSDYEHRRTAFGTRSKSKDKSGGGLR